MKLFKTGLILIGHDTKQEQMPQETQRGQKIVINMYQTVNVNSHSFRKSGSSGGNKHTE